jgi:hypothetical protein
LLHLDARQKLKRLNEMKKVTAIGFRSNSWYAGLNVTLPGTDSEANVVGTFLEKLGSEITPKDTDELLAKEIKFPLEGTIRSDGYFYPGKSTDPDDAWAVNHFVFQHELTVEHPSQ